MPGPTKAAFLAFIRNEMGISNVVLPDSAPVIGMALAVALAVVIPALRAVPIPQVDAAGVSLTSGCQTIYDLAVYNLAGDNLINYAPDVTDALSVPGLIRRRRTSPTCASSGTSPASCRG